MFVGIGLLPACPPGFPRRIWNRALTGDGKALRRAYRWTHAKTDRHGRFLRLRPGNRLGHITDGAIVVGGRVKSENV